MVIISNFLIPPSISTKDVEIFFDNSTSMIVSFNWRITLSINSIDGLVVDIKLLDVIFIVTTTTPEQINRPLN